MKKLTVLLSILAIIGLLSACGTNAETITPNDIATEQDTSTAEGSAPAEFRSEVPLQTALTIGTFKLDGTENEITAEQANELLPLWQVYKSLIESDTASNTEIQALINQIADTMTDAQMNQINNMNLTIDSMNALNEELGLESTFRRPETAEGEEGTMGANRPEGMPAGLGPGGGQGAGQGAEGLSPEQIEAMQATREAGGGFGGRGMGMVNTELINALIELLQSK